MAKYAIEDTTLSAIGNAIREKTGKTELLTPSNMAIEIEGISNDKSVSILNQTITEYSNSEITELGSYIFYGCRYLERVNTPNLAKIGDHVFYNCSNLQDISSQNITEINGDYIVYGCSKLENLDLSNLVKMGSDRFYYLCYGCQALKRVDLGNVPSRFYRYNFNDCKVLETLILRSSTLMALDNSTNNFSGTPITNGTGYIYVPSALIEQYKTATNWSVFADQFRAIEDYPNICG